MTKVDHAFLQRLLEVDTRYFTKRLNCISALHGGATDVAVKKWQDITAFLAASIPVADFNHVVGLNHDNVSALDEILAFYTAYNISPELSILPGDLSPALAKRLHAAGFSASRSSSMLFADLPRPAWQDDLGGIEITRIEDEKAHWQFHAVLQEGFGVPSEHLISKELPPPDWLSESNWRLFLAHLQGKPAAAAVLHLDNKIGYLASAATIPSARRQGLHGALIRHRLTVSHQEGCNIICGGASFGSQSQHNMQRAGLQLAGTISHWARIAQ